MQRKPWSRLHWASAGVLLGVLNVIVMNNHVFSRPIGASTSFPYLGGRILGLMDSAYMKLIAKPGHWEAWFLVGALIGAFVSSFIAGDFRFRFVPDRWKEVKGAGVAKRALWVVVGAVLLILGARLAGGCTSGHMLSGGMQLSVSSLTFGVVGIASLLVTGRLFYRR